MTKKGGRPKLAGMGHKRRSKARLVTGKKVARRLRAEDVPAAIARPVQQLRVERHRREVADLDRRRVNKRYTEPKMRRRQDR